MFLTTNNLAKLKTKDYLSTILAQYEDSNLDEEINAFVKSVDQEQEYSKVNEDVIVKKIKEVVTSVWSESTVQIYGSCLTGLSLPSSDLDVVISFGTNSDQKNQVSCVNDAIDQLMDVLLTKKNGEWIKKLTKINGPRVKIPLIKFNAELLVTRGNELISIQKKIDISFASPNHSGLYVSNGINEYKKKYPVLRPLALIIKKLKYCWNMPTSHNGGLSSYCLVMMIVSFLEMHGTGIISNRIGSLFIQFLYFFGCCFDFRKGLSPSLPFGSNSRKSIMFRLPSNIRGFVLYDPFNKKSNLACSVQDSRQITYTFQKILYRIDSLLKLYNDVCIQNVLKHVFSQPPLPPVTSRDSLFKNNIRKNVLLKARPDITQSPVAAPYESNNSKSFLASRLSKTYIQYPRKFIGGSWDSYAPLKQKAMTSAAYVPHQKAVLPREQFKNDCKKDQKKALFSSSSEALLPTPKFTKTIRKNWRKALEKPYVYATLARSLHFSGT